MAPLLMEKFIKWTAAAIVIVAAAFTSFDITPWNQVLFFTGNAMWMIVAYRWKEWSLFYVNLIMNLFYFYGIVNG